MSNLNLRIIFKRKPYYQNWSLKLRFFIFLKNYLISPMTPCLAAGCWLMFSYNSITCLVHSVKYLFTFPFSCPGEVFLSPQGFLVCSLKKAKQHYLLVFLFLRFARRKDKNEGHLFWNWNFTHINKSDPINNNLQLTQLTLKLL